MDPANCSPSGVSLHLRNACLTAMIPRLFWKFINALGLRKISFSTQFLYSSVSFLFNLALEILALAMLPFCFALRRDLVISRQSRYIIYGSSNLTLKKKLEPGG